MPKYLNAVRDGVGTLLTRFQRLRGGPRLGFMLRLASAPEISFVSYVDPASGQPTGSAGAV